MRIQQQTEATNDISDRDGHVELTNEPPERDSTEADDTSAARSPSKATYSSEDETLMNSSWNSLGDNDSRSVSSYSSTSSWGTAAISEMRFTMISNLLFFTSSTIQTIMALSDLKSAIKREAEEWADDDGWDDDAEYVYTFLDRAYYAFYSFAPFLCIISALFDVQYYRDSQTAPLLSWSFWCPCFFRNIKTYPSVEVQNLEQQQQQETYQFVPGVDRTNSIEEADDSDEGSYSTADSSVEENPYLHLVSAVLFGLGATVEFYSTFLYDYYEDVDSWDDDAYLIKQELKRPLYVSDYKIDLIGMHLYLLSGVVTLISQRHSFCSSFKCVFNKKEDSEADEYEKNARFARLLTLIGTVLFIGGTLLDCTIAWISDPEIRHGVDLHLDRVTLSIFGLTSCLCWNIDAVCYIWADVLVYSLFEKDSEARKLLFQSCKSKDNKEKENTEEDSREEYWDHESIPMIPDLQFSSSITSYSSINSDTT